MFLGISSVTVDLVALWAVFGAPTCPPFLRPGVPDEACRLAAPADARHHLLCSCTVTDRCAHRLHPWKGRITVLEPLKGRVDRLQRDTLPAASCRVVPHWIV